MLRAVLWKNVSIKRFNLAGTFAEIFLPALSVSLLIVLKSLSEVYDSPNVAFYCGQAFPWFYSQSLNYTALSLSNVGNIFAQCVEEPLDCRNLNYYQYPITFSFGSNRVVKTITGYFQNGKMIKLMPLKCNWTKLWRVHKVSGIVWEFKFSSVHFHSSWWSVNLPRAGSRQPIFAHVLIFGTRERKQCSAGLGAVIPRRLFVSPHQRIRRLDKSSVLLEGFQTRHGH